MEETTLHIYRTSGGNVFLSFWGSDVELYLGSADTPEAKDGECYTINPYTLKIEPRSKEVILPKTSEQIFTGDLQQRIAELERERDGLKKRVAELEAERASTAEPKTWEKKALKEYIEKFGPKQTSEPPAMPKCDKCGEFIGTWAPTCPTCAASPDTSRAALVAEARKLFAVLPLWVHWIAKDKDERWWAFSYEPSSSTDCEHTGGGRAFSLRNATYPAPTWRGDWRESKISRKECE